MSVLAVMLAVVRVGASAAAWADDDPDTHRPYLALSDSVVFGYITQAGFEYGNPDNFVGYPGYAAQLLRLTSTNASCPGEATSGFLSPTGADNGCRDYRQAAPLHVTYSSTQLLFAEGFLARHRNTRLVTIGIGANDVFILQGQCASSPNPQQCIGAGLPAVLATIAQNFRMAASNPFAGGQICKAGLLNASPQNQLTCDVHPSQSGQKLIGQTVASTFRAARWADE